MKHVSLTDFRRFVKEDFENMKRGPEGRIVLTAREKLVLAKPVAVLMSYADYIEMLEEIRLLEQKLKEMES